MSSLLHTFDRAPATAGRLVRSTFNRDFNHKTSFNAGDGIPFYWDEVLPGDTFNINTNFVIRQSNPSIVPVMDNAYVSLHFFFIPNRLTWKYWKNFMGENTTQAGIPTVTYQIPQLVAPSGGFVKDTIADYLGVPLYLGISVSRLPFNAYALIYNEWYRNQNVQAPVLIDFESPFVTAVIAGWGTNFPYFYPFKVNKIHDYFTSALPYAQKGNPVSLPLGTSAPVVTSALNHGILQQNALRFGGANQQSLSGNPSTFYYLTHNPSNSSNTTAYASNQPSATASQVPIVPLNLEVNLSNATSATINDLRLAIQTQAFLERDARGGTRYTEMIRSHFGVISSDSRQQRPEYLGGMRVPLSMNQVVQTSATQPGAQNTPQGNLTAYSHTASNGGSFVKSFDEHGLVMGIIDIRTEQTYQNGVNRSFTRLNRTDFYFPVFSNIGEQPIRNREIFYANQPSDTQTFGFQEAWADYRYLPNRVSGAMRSAVPIGGTSLDIWHYAPNFTSLPILGTVFMQQGQESIDRALSVLSSQEDQFVLDIMVRNKATRLMPLYSIPWEFGRL